ncbi:MAG: hypothetical protein WBC44_17550 [Planctomycetaceae bacterium]
MNPLAELHALVELFPEPELLVARAEHVAAPLMPEPYRRMLAHEHHMTVTMEQQHGGPVDVTVLARRDVGGMYCRKIILTKRGTDQVVQFGLVRFDFSYVTPAVRDEILSEQIPLGRVLIRHNVLRHIDLGALLRIEAGPGLAKLLTMSDGGLTYGRLATIFCNGRPAVDLLEITAPLT